MNDPVPSVPAPRPARSSAGFWVVIILLILFLGVSLALNAGLFMALFVRDGMQAAPSDAEDEYPQFTETHSYGAGDIKVVRIALDGIISRQLDGGLFGATENMTEHLLRQVRAAGQDDEVAAIVLEVNSPGGEVTSSDEIFQALKAFRDSRDDRRVIVFVRDLCASGGYYASMAADWIVAEPTALVGSIGVIMQSLNWSTLTDKIGVTDTTIKSGANKDLLNPFQPVDPEDVTLLQELVDDMFNRFSGIVAAGRNMDTATLKPLADGRIFTASQALENGLIDELGYWDDAMSAVHRLLETDSVRFIRYDRHTSFLGLLFSARVPNPLPSLRQAAVPKMLYLWQP